MSIYAIHLHTSVQLTTTEDESLNGFMVASREDTGPELNGSAPYVGSWVPGTDMKLLCNGVSTPICSVSVRVCIGD